MKRNIFVIGLDPFNLDRLSAISHGEYRFYPLLDLARARDAEHIDFNALLDQAREELARCNQPVHAIVNYWDYPSSCLTPILRRELGLRTPTLESVIKMEHKLWARLLERESMGNVPNYHRPEFQCVDLCNTRCADDIELTYPFWLKGIKSHSSHVMSRVSCPEEFESCRVHVMNRISRMGMPFSQTMEHADLPPEIAAVHGMYCLLEEELGGHQCTLEGYVLDGEICVYGIIDSFRRQDSLFTRYQYPSRLPRPVQARMGEAARRLIAHMGYDNQAFNIEFFYDEQRDRLSMLEVNSRHSQSHADLFLKVDGLPNHEVMLSLALGEKPRLQPGRGKYACAAKFFLRRQEQATVVRVPSPEQIRAIERDMPDTHIAIETAVGNRLDAQLGQARYELANIYVGARSEGELMGKYQRCAEALDFELERSWNLPPGSSRRRAQGHPIHPPLD